MILFVCTGNICRSAMGEILFRNYANELGVEVKTTSGGVLAWDGSPITDAAKEILNEAGILEVEHTSQQLTVELVEQASLVVAMTREHAQGAIARYSPAKKYTFLTGELLRLMKKLPLKVSGQGDAASQNQILQDWVAELDKSREKNAIPAEKGSVIGLASDEVADPAIGNLEDHRKVYEPINELALLLAENLKPKSS